MTLEVLGQIATILTPLIAIGGLIGLGCQIRAAREAAADTTAAQFYRQLISKALRYPQFVAPEQKKVDTKNETFDGDRIEFRRYEMFVDLLLTTFDQMRELRKPDRATDLYMLQWIGEHRELLASDYFRENFWDQLTAPMQKLVEQALRD
jgi:hypothetical protein